MKRRGAGLFIIALAALALAGCSYFDRTPEQRYRDLPPAASARFLPDGHTIEVVVSDPVPLDAAELVAPDGTPSPAARISHPAGAADDTGLRPQVGIIARGGPVSGVDAGVGISLPVFGSGSALPPLESRAEFPVTDMEGYRATWKLWEIRLRIGRQLQDARYLTIPAPPPP